MNESKLVKIGLIQAIGFLFYGLGVFALSFTDWENPLIYFFVGVIMIAFIVLSAVFIVFYFLRDKQ